MDCIYLDNSATTMATQGVAKKVMELLTERYGNPSSLHSKGLEAETEVTIAKNAISNALDCTAKEIFFTSGGTESNNLAVFGAVEALKRRGNKIITTAIEHSSVIEPIKHLENMGFSVTYLTPQANGKISLEQLENAVDNKTILVSCMLVNNEIGTIQPVEKIKRLITRKGSPALLHCDAVQGFGKIPIQVNKLGVDLLTVTAHKIHGPKGIGALYIKKGTRIVPRTFGGEQQNKIRPGTESTPLIGGFGVAVDEISYDSLQHIKQLQNLAIEKLSTIKGVTVNSPKDNLPYILNVSAVGIRSETMLHYLAAKGVYVSSGSACAKGKKSHVLSALGLDDSIIDSAIRISFSKFNTPDDINYLYEGIKNGTEVLARK